MISFDFLCGNSAAILGSVECVLVRLWVLSLDRLRDHQDRLRDHLRSGAGVGVGMSRGYHSVSWKSQNLTENTIN